MSKEQPDPAEIFTPFTPGAAQPAENVIAAEPRQKRRKANPKATEAPPAKLPRKKRTVPKVRMPAALKMPVHALLAAVNELKQGDVELFEKILGILNGAGKTQRTRVLAAIGKVFG